MKKFLLIDTFNFLHRAYHALPKTLTNSAGEPTNAVYGVTSMLISIFETVKPDYVVAALDDETPTFRSEGFKAYKAQRKPVDEDLTSQIPKVMEILDAFNITKLCVPGFEADDLIATIIDKFDDDSIDFIVASNDQDLWQLVKKNVLILTPKTQGTGDWIGEKEVIARMGFEPKYVPQYKALKGDVSDNIPGVYGIGEKTAIKLISEYKTIEELYKYIDNIKPESVKIKLVKDRDQAFMSRDLATVVKNVTLSTKIDDCKYSTFNLGKVKDILEKYHFKSLIKRLGFSDALDKQHLGGAKQVISKAQMPLL